MAMKWFKKDRIQQPMDVKSLRGLLLNFIKEELQRFEGGEGRNIQGISLFISSTDGEKSMYEAAAYLHDKDKLKLEIQRLIDDYALDIPEGWALDVSFTDSFASETRRSAEIGASIIINTKSEPARDASVALKAIVKIVNGVAEETEYILPETEGKINIGRGKEVKLGDGSVRVNHIAFSDDASDLVNQYISRRHAHFEWDAKARCLMIYADDGGIPPGNKTRIKVKADLNTIRLNATDIGYRLADGDSVILGGSAILEISYLM